MRLRHCLNRPGCRCGLLHAPARLVSPDPVFGFGVYRDGVEHGEDEPTLPSARHPFAELEFELPVAPWWRSLLGLFALE